MTRLQASIPPILQPMTDWLPLVLVPFIGLAGGFAVGSAFVALLIVLDLIPRLVQMTRAYRRSWIFESAIVSGAIYWICADYFNWKLGWTPGALLVPAIFEGLFVGMLAAALTEVLNVIPIVADRLRLKPYLFALLIAMALGKVAGSLVDWLLLQP
jgi:stage V sporulation protein AB